MTKQDFAKIEPSVGGYVKLTYRHNGKEFADNLFYRGRRGTDKVLFEEGNWANDFLLINIKHIIKIESA